VTWAHQRGFLLPTHAQYWIEDAAARPDFVYTDRDARVAIYIDGPVHDHPDIQERDAHAEARLFSKGWLVQRFKMSERGQWDSLAHAHPDVYGPGDTQ
jgi:very-short-patch-repair endonuclease